MTGDATSTADPATRLGRQIGVRWRRPGPPVGQSRPALIGSVSQSARRFVQGIGRPVMVRRALAGPATAARASTRDLDVRPPRWWSPASVFAAERDAVSYDFSARRVPQLVRPMPQGTPGRPGGHLVARRAQVVPMRLPAEVRAVGRITTEADTRSRRARPPAAGKARAPGKNGGAGTAPSAPVTTGSHALQHVPTGHDPITAVSRTASPGSAPHAVPGAAPLNALPLSSALPDPAAGGPAPAMAGWASRLVRRRAATARRVALTRLTADAIHAARPSRPTTPTPPSRPTAATAPSQPIAVTTPSQPTAATPPSRPTAATAPSQPSVVTPLSQPVSATPLTAPTPLHVDSLPAAPGHTAPGQTATESTATASAPPTPSHEAPTEGAQAEPARRLTLAVNRLWTGVPHRVRHTATERLTDATALPYSTAVPAAHAATPPTARAAVRPAALPSGPEPETGSVTVAGTPPAADVRPLRRTGTPSAPAGTRADERLEHATTVESRLAQTDPPRLPGASRPLDHDGPIAGPLGSGATPLPQATAGTAPGAPRVSLVGRLPVRRTSTSGTLGTEGTPAPVRAGPRHRHTAAFVSRLTQTDPARLPGASRMLDHDGPIAGTLGSGATPLPQATAGTAPGAPRVPLVGRLPVRPATRTPEHAEQLGASSLGASSLGASSLGASSLGASPLATAPIATAPIGRRVQPTPAPAGTSVPLPGTSNPQEPATAHIGAAIARQSATAQIALEPQTGQGTRVQPGSMPDSGVPAARHTTPTRTAPVRRSQRAVRPRRDAAVSRPGITMPTLGHITAATFAAAGAAPPMPAVARAARQPGRAPAATAVGDAARHNAGAVGAALDRIARSGAGSMSNAGGIGRWYAPAAGLPGVAPSAAMPVLPPRTIVRRAPAPVVAEPTSRIADRLAASPAAGTAATTAMTAGATTVSVGQALRTPIIRRFLGDTPTSLGGTVAEADTAGPAASGAAGGATASGWDEEAVTAIVRRVLDEELRDRVNTVVDVRIESETERRRWRRDLGAF